MNETMLRIQAALALPLSNRCEVVGHLIKECSQKELQTIFPILLEHIFRINNQTGWGICSMPLNPSSRESESVYQFLHPNGTVFNLIYRLMSDCYLKYDFPLMLLPPNVRQIFEEDRIPSYYLDKLQYDQHTKTVTSLSLNPFEYYIFHFATHLVNPWVAKNATSQAETVYILMCEEYLASFLPCDVSYVVPHIDYYIVKTPVPRPPVVTTPARTPTLFRQSILSKANPPASMHSSPTPPSSNTEVWRTETVIQAFVDLWLSYGSKDMSSPARIRELPSVDRVRAVRLMIKHFHYFSNSANKDFTQMGDLRCGLRQVTRKKIYTFFRRTIQDWPLDSSFRVVLETWLSYLQPWRYVNYQARTRNNIQTVKDSEDIVRTVDRYWMDFVVDNLFAYTVIFQQLIPRFARLDLTTPRNAHMLQRVSKVFSQPNLNIMLAEVEGSLSDEIRWAACSSVHSQSGSRVNGTIYELVTTSAAVASMGDKWNYILRQLLQQLEGPHYEYIFLFDYKSEKIQDTLQMVFEANVAARVLLKVEEQMKKEKTWTIVSLLKDLFSSSADMSEYSLEERRRVVMYLESSLQYLASFFKVPAPVIPDIRNMTLQDIRSLMRPGCNSLYQLMSSSVFTPEGHSTQSWHNLRLQRPCVTYEGDPDLQPVKTTECAFLVRVLHFIASKLNETYEAEMYRCFYREDFVGQVARQILSPPLVVRSYNKSVLIRFAPLVEKVLPPRISLRPLASITLLTYLGILYIIFWICGLTPMSLFLFLLGFWILYILISAIFEPFRTVQSMQNTSSPEMNISDVSDRDVSS